METNDQDRKYEDAAYAYTIGRFEDAAAGFTELANLGHAKAAKYLAEMYLRGEGVAKSVEQALQLLEFAVSKGESLAAFSLGALHRSGDDGVPKDAERSRRFFTIAKELGCKLPVDEYL